MKMNIMNKKLLFITLGVVLFQSASVFAQQNYLKRDGDRIVDAQGNNVLLRGIGLGNYMVWEPYMWSVSNYVTGGNNTMHAILNRIGKALDPADLSYFVDQYMANYITRRDVDSLKAWGFNSIRLPMHYNLFISKDAADNTYIEKGFEMTERLRQWCEANQMYLILDLHAAPGGQGDDHAISDSDGPALWTGDVNGTADQYQTKTLLFWQEVARRFADKEWIGGYDLLNETNYSNPALLSLYKRIVKQIRQYDNKHLILLEGNWFANDFSSISPDKWGTDWDANTGFSCHRYWSGHNSYAGSSLRDTYNVPLWLGESGENSNEWFYKEIKNAESLNVGWAWWAYKKIDNISGLLSIKSNTAFEKIKTYLNNETGLDINDKAGNLAIFKSFLDNVRIENCKINRDVIFSMIGQQSDATATRPYGANLVPGVIPANEYDMGLQGYAYNENSGSQVVERTSSSDAPYNQGWTGRNDAVDFNKTSGTADEKSNGYNVGWTSAGEWLKYTVNATVSGRYKIYLRVACTGSSTISIKSRNDATLLSRSIPATGGYQTWTRVDMGTVDLVKGWNTLKLYFDTGGINVNYLDFVNTDALAVSDNKVSGCILLVGANTLTVKADQDVCTLTIHDTLGKVVKWTQNQRDAEISNLSGGVYLVQVSLADAQSFQFKFYKK